MKKTFLIFLIVILISSQVSALSLFGAQDISRNYLSGNEMIDSYTQPKISCEDDEYFVIPIINSLGEPILFVPISVKSSELFISKTESFNIRLIKTEYLLKQLTNSDSSNYLSLQLIDRINNLINSLNSKKAQLNGFLEKDYSYPVKEQLTITINKLDVLIVYLNELRDNLSSLLSEQNSFISSPNCNDTSALLNSFESAFKGYSDISQKSLEYIQASELLVTRFVADESIPSQEVTGIINIISPPQTLNSQVNYISESLSSTSAFYIKISNNLKGSVGNEKMKLYIDNLVLRNDFVIFKNLLEKYDSKIPNYANLESLVNTILDQEYRLLWKEQGDVEIVKKTYNEIKDLSSRAQYSQAISKVPLLRDRAINVINNGFIEVEEEINWLYYFSVGLIIIILIVFLIVIKKKKKNKMVYKKPKSKKQDLDILKFDDPFN
jgi:tetrahydromethanopterin S-methyltransferase subunit B